MFNVSDIIMMQQPDSDGHKIPPGTLHGTAVLAAASAGPQWINVGVSVGIFNVSTATCIYKCPNCPMFTDFRVQADQGTALIGQNTQFSSWALSSGGWSNFTLLSSWSSDNTQVAQPGGTVGGFYGVGAGSFNAQATANLPNGCEPGAPACPTDQWMASAPGFIQVPTSLNFISVSVFPDGTSGAVGCPGSAWSGIRVDIKYQVLDQHSPGQAIHSSNMTPHERGTLFSGSPYNNNIGPVSGYPTSGATTASDGTFHDVPFGACANGTFSSVTATQNITMLIGTTSYPVRSQNWTVTGVTLGHGTVHNSITSPGTGSDVSASR